MLHGQVIDHQPTARQLLAALDDQEITTLGEEAKVQEIPDGMMVILRVVEGHEPGRGYQVAHTPCTIGRDPLSEISLNDPRMSRQHAVLTYTENKFQIKDLGSTNGTFVNDKRIKQAVLSNGDRVRMGNTTLEFIQSNLASA